MLHRVALVRTDVSEELSASIIRVTRIGERETTLLCDIVFLCSLHQLLVMASIPSSPILFTLMMEALSSSETRFLQEPHGVTSQKTAYFIHRDDVSGILFFIYLWGWSGIKSIITAAIYWPIVLAVDNRW
jgi:hypothetical protein